MKDRKLLRELKKGAPDALDRIIDKYGGYVSMIVFYTMGAGACREDGEETVADVFLSLWEKADRIGEDVCLRSYLAAMARNRATDRLRSRQYREGQRIGRETEKIEKAGEESIREDPVIRAEENDVLLGALRQLDETEQTIFFRYYYLGETAAAVAAKTGMKEATVRTRLARGRKKLERILKKGGYFDV